MLFRPKIFPLNFTQYFQNDFGLMLALLRRLVAAYELYEAANHARTATALLCCVFDLSLSLYGLALVPTAYFLENSELAYRHQNIT